MMCEQLNKAALALLPVGYKVRNCRPDELDVWKLFLLIRQKRQGRIKAL